MDINQKPAQSGKRIQSPICRRQITTELTKDFSLPDYQPEIKRLLRVTATVTPPDKYIGGGSAECSGSVDFCILYSGNDGALYSATETEEYSFSVPVEIPAEFEIGDGILCDAETAAEQVTCRVTGPRGLSLKCRLHAQVRLYGTRILDERIKEERGLERLCGTAECARVFAGVGDPLTLGDEIIPDGTTDDLRVIAAEGQVFVAEASAGSGNVNCRGEVALKLLCVREIAGAPERSNTIPTALTRKIPFTCEVPVDGAEVNCDAAAHGVCTDLHVTVEDGRIQCEVTLRLTARAQRNETVEYTRDLYSVESNCKNEYTDCTLPVALKTCNGNFSLNLSLPLADVGIRSGAEVVDFTLFPTVTGVENERGKYYLTGKCRAHAILADEGEMSAQEFEVPFRFESDSVGVDAVDYDAAADVISCRARADGERLGVDAELAVSAALRGETTLRMLTAAELTDAVEDSGAVYTICYPTKEDTLWSIAKQYHRPVEEIVRQNSLADSPAADSPASLGGVGYLLV